MMIKLPLSLSLSKKMTKLSINLIRHGEKRLFLPDPGLTELGQEQAEKLAQHLSNSQKSKHLTKNQQSTETQQASKTKHLILCSPKRRTRETAEIIAKQLKLDVQVDDFLNIDNVLPNTPANKNRIIEHFKKYLGDIEYNSLEPLEIFAVTHSQEVRNFWRILGGPDEAIKDVYECGVWTVIVDGEKNIVDEKKDMLDRQKIDFTWTEGELNP